MPVHYTPISLEALATPHTFNAPLEELDEAIEALRDGNLTLDAPDINNYSNANHDHTNAAGGGRLPFDAIDVDAESVGDILRVVDIGGGVKRVRGVSIGVFVAGMMLPYAPSTTPPAGWLLCDGQAVSRATYAGLFAALGTTYGVGDGSTTFNLPSMRGRVPAGMDDMGTGAANVITNSAADTVGGVFGGETHTLNTAEIPAHQHIQRYYSGANGSAFLTPSDRVAISGSVLTNFGTTTANAGGDGAHNNVQPTLFLPWIIKT